MKKPIAGIIMASLGKKPDMKEEKDEMGEGPEMGIAQDVLDAIHAKDTKMLSEALEAAFMHYDSQPHTEGPDMKEGE